MRLGFAIAAHIEADVLLLDEVFAVGDEAFQRKCFGKIFEFKQRGGTIVFVSHDAASVERLCDRAVLLKDGAVAFDGPTHEAIVAYRQLLAGERNPEERAAGLKEWGGDVARVERVRLLGPAGDERMQLLVRRAVLDRARRRRRARRSRRRGSAGSCATTRRSSSPAAPSRPRSSAGATTRGRCRSASRPSARRSPTAASTSASTSPTSAARRSTTRSTTRSSSSSIRPTTRAASSGLKDAGRSAAELERA